MDFFQPISKPKQKVATIEVPTVARAINATVCISDVSPVLNIEKTATSLTENHTIKDLKKSRMLQTALKMGLVVAASRTETIL